MITLARTTIAIALLTMMCLPHSALAEEESSCFAKETWSCGDVDIELCKLATDVKQVTVTGGLQKIAGPGVTLKWGKRDPWLNGKRCKADKKP
jgi:hypothetical protein